SGSVTMSGLTITQGNSNDGGGILNHGTLTLTNCSLTHNTAGGLGGAIDTDGTVTLTSCTISDNSASAGGGILGSGTPTLSECTIHANSAGGAGGAIDLFVSAAVLTATNCTISGNPANAACGLEIQKGTATF